MKNPAANLCGLLVLAVIVTACLFTPTTRAGARAVKKAGGDSTAPKEEVARIPVEDWLIIGPVPSPFPAFSGEGETKIDTAYLLSYEYIPIEKLNPAEGEEIALPGGKRIGWRAVSADTNGVSIPVDTTLPYIAYLAAYIEVPRWLVLKVEAVYTHPFQISIDGEPVVECGKKRAAEPAGGKKSGTAELERGKHVLVAKTLYMPADTVSGWRLGVRIGADEKYGAVPKISITPNRHLSLKDVIDIADIRAVAVSPDGGLVALVMRRIASEEGNTEEWIEIRQSRDGGLYRTMKDIPGVSGVRWAPQGNRLSYITRKQGKGTLRVIDIESGESETVVENVEDLGGYAWGPDGSFMVYSITEKPEEDKTGVKRLMGIYDRWSYGRNRSYLYVSTVPGGYKRRITAGKHNCYIHDINPDGASLLFTRHFEDLSERPYGASELILLNLEDQESEVLWKGPWLRGASWSPDGMKILVLAGPSSFGSAGKNVREGVTPNEYDTQAYLFDPVTKKVDPLTTGFAPKIIDARWSRADGHIYFTAEDGPFRRLFRYDPGKKTFRRIDLGFDYLDEWDMALDGRTAAIVGSGTSHPPRLYTADLKRDRARQVYDPSADDYRHIRLGKVETWNFTSGEGGTIEGRIHYPPDFDPGKRYPCIVYYYGGTSPTPRNFGGRYPKNLWASMGYVVYVLQPSGATGYGQEFSARHVNDWGKTVADEIIEGVSLFIKEHPFVDAERIGCIGASYGGFMTQLLVTKTDIFAAAVSHAGISSITSYWGEGYWGYSYSAVASANSFPWNRPDIYIGQSPLFSADKIDTPLLLLHGADDTNVPPGESDQMYIAMKLLGKNVEYVRFSGQNHFILDYKKRIIWSNTISAWFDRWLKDEPEWWDDMYPPLNGEEPVESEDIGPHVYEIEDWGSVMMGKITREDIIDNIPGWDAEYFDYDPDYELFPELERYIFGVNIKVILGTWCSDSRREVPRLWKILEELQYPVSEVSMFAVGSSRFTEDMPIPPRMLEWSDSLKSRYGVERVATIIIERGGREIGRIVETPEESLEKHLLSIIR